MLILLISRDFYNFDFLLYVLVSLAYVTIRYYDILLKVLFFIILFIVLFVFSYLSILLPWLILSLHHAFQRSQYFTSIQSSLSILSSIFLSIFYETLEILVEFSAFFPHPLVLFIYTIYNVMIVLSLSLSSRVISMAMGLCAANSAGHLSNHADVAPNHAGITFAISNTIVS